MSQPSAFKRYQYILTLLAAYSILIIQYLQNRSVWNDEAFMALTVTNVDARDLFFPLDYYQAAPVLFLQIEKLTTVLFGQSEYALRLFPLVSAIAAVPLFYSFCLRFTGNRILSLSAMILLAVTPAFIYYSSEIKQYCIDLFVIVLLYNAAFNDAPFLARRRTLILSIAGIVTIFLSNVSVVILFTIGLYFLGKTIKTKKISREHLIPAIAWMMAFVINYLLFIWDHPNTEYMRNYWMIAFMPIDIFSPAFSQFAGRSIHQIFSQLLPSLPGGYFYLVTLLLFLTGLYAMFREKMLLPMYLCLAPIIIHLALSALHIYPFELRMLLYHVPLYILSVTFGLFWIINKLIADSKTRIIVAGLSLAAISFKTFMTYPVDHDKIKDAIAYINTAHKPGESIYIASGAVPGIRYYRQRGIAKFDNLSIELGKQRVQDKSYYLQNIDKLHGRVWRVSSDVFPFRNNYEEEMAIANAMKQRAKLIAEKDFVGSTVYLYDFP